MPVFINLTLNTIKREYVNVTAYVMCYNMTMQNNYNTIITDSNSVSE